MANVSAPLVVTFKPAFYALVSCAEVIAEEQGKDVAVRWANEVLSSDFDLFCSIEADHRPQLRVIQGGR